MLFKGSMVALVTPFENGKIDEASLRKLVDFHVENKTDVIVPCGTTGESATMTHEEHERVIQICVEQAQKKCKILAGAGSNSTSEALRLHKFCEGAGADGALHITPYYNKPTQEGLKAHYKALSESSDLPIVLYNVPSRTGLNMQASTVIELAEISNVVGVKEASGDLEQASLIIKNTPSDFGLYSGEDAITFPLYAIGAMGSISVTANLIPALLKEQWDAMESGDFLKAKEIHFNVLNLHQKLFVETNPIPVKMAVSQMGFCAEEYRLPLVKISNANREVVLKAMKELNLI